MKPQNLYLKPQDILLLLKLVSLNSSNWNQISVADSIGLSQSEVSEAVRRCKYAGLLDPSGKAVMKLGLTEFLQFGLSYAFPQRPGALVRGIPTAHSAPPLNSEIVSNEHYVWPSVKGTVRGQAVVPLYPSVVKAVKNDEALYELLALVDAIRVGRAREKDIARKELSKRLLDDSSVSQIE